MRWAGLLLLSLMGCGVAGRPSPPGAVPAPPTDIQVVSLPSGLEIQAKAPTLDLDGDPLEGAPNLLVFFGESACTGAADARLKAGRLRLPVPKSPTTAQVVASFDRRRSQPQRVALEWTAPPPAPEAPLAFVDRKGQVQLTWLPPPVPEIIVVRDGRLLARVAAESAQFTDTPPPGPHRYRLLGAGASFRTAPSSATQIQVPAR